MLASAEPEETKRKCFDVETRFCLFRRDKPASDMEAHSPSWLVRLQLFSPLRPMTRRSVASPFASCWRNKENVVNFPEWLQSRRTLSINSGDVFCWADATDLPPSITSIAAKQITRAMLALRLRKDRLLHAITCSLFSPRSAYTSG